VVNELEDLNGTPIDGQFYRDELNPARISSRTTYNIDKLLVKRVRNGVRKFSSAGRFSEAFDTWVRAASVKYILHDVIK